MPGAYPIINGKPFSWNSVRLKGNGVSFFGFKQFDYSQETKRDQPYGPHPDPLGTTQGENSYKCSIEVLRNEFAAFILLLGGQGFGQFPIFWTCSYWEIGQPPVTDVIENCLVNGIEASNAKGGDAAYVKLNFMPTKIRWNGIDSEFTPLELAQLL